MIFGKKSSDNESYEQESYETRKFNILEFFQNNMKLLIFAIILVLVIFILLLINRIFNAGPVSSRNGLSIKLLGGPTITVKAKDNFLDPGYVAIDKVDGDITKEVQLIGIIDLNTPGKYDRFYVVENSRGTIVEIKRTIVVEEPTEEDGKDDIKLNLSLKGSTVVVIEKGNNYLEPGYVAYDDTGKDLTKEVKVSHNINNNTVGTYQVTYDLAVDSVNKTATRTVKVVDPKTDNGSNPGTTPGNNQDDDDYYYDDEEEQNGDSDGTNNSNTNIKASIAVSNTNLTKNPVTITLNITGSGYSYTILPSDEKTTNTTIKYTVSSNGIYVFNIYDKNGEVVTVEKAIDNIDDEIPVANCTGQIKDDNKTYLTVNASDKNGISGYVFKSGSVTSPRLSENTYVINSRTKDATVTVYDKTGNSVTTICNISGDLGSAFAPIKPSGYNSSLSSESATLKVYTVKKDGYYLIYIWAQNPYLQFHNYSAKMSGKTYDTIAGLFNGALKKNANGVKNKITVAFNSDVSVYYGSYYYCRKNEGCPWNSYTSGGLIIREGSIYRNDPKTNGKRNVTYSMTKNNKLVVLNDKNNFSNYQTRESLYNALLAEEPRNTFSALHVMMYNGEELTKKYNPYQLSHVYPKGSNAAALRNGICQVNDNNFVYFVSNTKKTEDKMVSIFKKLGCKVAINNDGGGSTNFWFKKASSSSWKKVVGSGSRGRMDTIAYWTEL